MLKINLLVLFLKVTAYDESTLETFYNKLTHVSRFGGGIIFIYHISRLDTHFSNPINLRWISKLVFEPFFSKNYFGGQFHQFQERKFTLTSGLNNNIHNIQYGHHWISMFEEINITKRLGPEFLDLKDMINIEDIPDTQIPQSYRAWRAI